MIDAPRLPWQDDDSARTVGAVRMALTWKHHPSTGAVRTAGRRTKRGDVAGGQRGENQDRGEDMTGFHGREVGLKQRLSVILLSFIAARFKVPALKPRPS
jgi:hypothetical protein